MAERIDVRGVLATVIADLRASGDTGMVENLLEADAAIAELIASAQIGLNYLPANGLSIERLRAALARVSGGA